MELLWPYWCHGETRTRVIGRSIDWSATGNASGIQGNGATYWNITGGDKVAGKGYGYIEVTVGAEAVVKEDKALLKTHTHIYTHTYAEALPISDFFPYLGRTIAYNNSNWEAVYQNLWKARRLWGMLARLIEKTRATVQSMGVVYKALVQSVLLY